MNTALKTNLPLKLATQVKRRELLFDLHVKNRLIPLLAELHELVPLLIQWQNEPSEAFVEQHLGNFFSNFVNREANGEASLLECSTADLETWCPVKLTRTSKKKEAKPKLTAETLIAAFDNNPADLTQAHLAKPLGVSSAAVGKVAKTCIEQGILVQTNGRPKCFALVSAEENKS